MFRYKTKMNDRSVPIFQHLDCNDLTMESQFYVDGVVQDFSNSSALTMELLQFYTKPSICMIQAT